MEWKPVTSTTTKPDWGKNPYWQTCIRENHPAKASSRQTQTGRRMKCRLRRAATSSYQGCSRNLAQPSSSSRPKHEPNYTSIDPKSADPVGVHSLLFLCSIQNFVTTCQSKIPSPPNSKNLQNPKSKIPKIQNPKSKIPKIPNPKSKLCT